MTDYNKLTVIQIRELFKSRGIAVTGLTRKQQLIERLIEADQAQAAPEEPSDAAAPENDNTVESTVDAPDSAETAGDENRGQDAPEVDVKSASPLPASDDAPDHSEPTSAPSDQTLEAVQAQNEEPPPRDDAVSGESVHNNADETLQATIPPRESSLPKADPSEAEVPPEPKQPSASVSTTTSPAPEDNRKRKRRSSTPSVTEEEVKQKKAKQEAEGAHVILKEDIAPDDGSAETPMTMDAPVKEPDEFRSDDPKVEDPSPMDNTEPSPGGEPEIGTVETGTEQADTQPKEPKSYQNVEGTTDSRSESISAPNKLPENEKMYRHLKSEQSGKVSNFGLDGSGEPTDALEDRDVAPAMHPATSALYIRDFMRPLRPDALESYLASLAIGSKSQDGPSQESRGDIIHKFYLDAIRTHCFVVFTSVSAASRVRSAIHDRVWPPEGNRKPLWADFVPEDKVEEWVEMETTAAPAGRPAGPKRWDVVYDRSEDGTIMTSLREASGVPLGPKRTLTQGSNTAPPTGPSGRPGAMRSDSTAMSRNTPQQTTSFLALDTLFKSTSAKPKLYFMPVSKELADRRLDELDALTTRHNAVPPGGSGYADSRRYTFEKDDMLVDNGPEFGLQGRGPPRRYRGR